MTAGATDHDAPWRPAAPAPDGMLEPG